MGRFIDTDPTPDEYMYHRQLIRLTGAYANLAAEDIQLRVATAATAGGAEASTETFPVTEWLGKDLPPHVAGFKTEFFTQYQDPTETRANLDALAAQYPELVSVVNMPEKTSGYQRKSQAIMTGTTAIGSAPPVTLGPLLIDTTGEITAAQPVASIPFTGDRGAEHPRDRRRHPGRLDRLHPDHQGPDRHRSCSRSTRARARRSSTQVLRHDAAPTPTRSRASRATSATSRSRSRRSSPTAVVLTAKDWGQEGGNQVMAEFRNPGATNQPLASRSTAS